MILQFMYDGQNSEARWALQNHLEVVLLFHSDEERKCFENYTIAHVSEIESRIAASTEYDYIHTDNETKTQSYKERLRLGIILRKMLSEFRAEHNINDELSFVNPVSIGKGEYINEGKW